MKVDALFLFMFQNSYFMMKSIISTMIHLSLINTKINDFIQFDQE